MKTVVKISSDGTTKRHTWHLVFHFYSSLFFFLWLLSLDCKAANNDAIKSVERMKERVCVNPKICRLTGCRRETRKEKTNNTIFHYYFKNRVSLFITALACNDHRPSSIIIVQLVWLHIQILFNWLSLALGAVFCLNMWLYIYNRRAF